MSKDNQNDEKLQKLLKLKNYETPGDEYFEDFLVDLKERQRRDAMQASSLLTLRDRMAQWFQELGPERWAVPAGSMAAVAITFFAISSRNQPLSEDSPIVSQDHPGKTETHVFELQLPKPQNSPVQPASTPAGYVPASSVGYLREL